MEIRIESIEKINEGAKAFLDAIGSHRIVAFYGKMGAGKTTFIKAICQCLGTDDVVTSPTFAIVNEYQTANPEYPRVFHFDFYRIRKLEEVYDMGYEDYFYSGQLCLLEWPELIEDILPDDALRVDITEEPDGTRTITTRVKE